MPTSQQLPRNATSSGGASPGGRPPSEGPAAYQPRVGVVLAGCGGRDGSEIRESVLVLLSLDRAGARAICVAPDVPQPAVVDHLTGQASVPKPKRGVLAES